MKLTDGFQLIEMEDEYLAIPVGNESRLFQGIVSLNGEAFFLLKHMKDDVQKEDLINLLTSEYNVSDDIAKLDIETFLDDLLEIGLIHK